MEGVQFSNILYALMLRGNRHSELPDELLERSTRLQSRVVTLELPDIFWAFLDKIATAGSLHGLIEETLISKMMRDPKIGKFFERFANYYLCEKLNGPHTGGRPCVHTRSSTSSKTSTANPS